MVDLSRTVEAPFTISLNAVSVELHIRNINTPKVVISHTQAQLWQKCFWLWKSTKILFLSQTLDTNVHLDPHGLCYWDITKDIVTVRSTHCEVNELNHGSNFVSFWVPFCKFARWTDSFGSFNVWKAVKFFLLDADPYISACTSKLAWTHRSVSEQLIDQLFWQTCEMTDLHMCMTQTWEHTNTFSLFRPWLESALTVKIRIVEGSEPPQELSVAVRIIIEGPVNPIHLEMEADFWKAIFTKSRTLNPWIYSIYIYFEFEEILFGIWWPMCVFVNWPV